MSKKKEKAPKPEAAPAGEAGAEGAPAKKKLPMMLIIGVVAGLLVLGGGGGAAYFLFLKPKPEAHAAVDEHGKPIKEEAAAGKKDEKKKEEKGGHGEAAATPPGPNDPVVAEGPEGIVYYTPKAFMVSMQSPTPGSRGQMLQLKLTFELPNQETADSMTASLPRLTDALESFLSELRPDEVSAGIQGRYQLKMEILRRANLIVAPEKIQAVNIEDLLVS